MAYTFGSIISVTLILIGCVSSIVSEAAERPPNIILIMADDLGYECLSSNGSTAYETPQLEALAKKGMRFTQCYSQPLCTPSRVQIMTGRYNHANYEYFGYLNPKEFTLVTLPKMRGMPPLLPGNGS